MTKDTDAGRALAEAVCERIIAPHREIAEQVRREMLPKLDDDVIGKINESHVVFGTACAYEAAKELAEYQATFDAQWTAQMRAVERWRAANPGNDLVLPDHEKLITWLLDQIGSMRGDVQ